MTRNRRCSPQTLELLSAFLEAPRQWRHGYDLARETGLKSGTLYPILMRLSDRGMLDSKWLEATERGRPPRHSYQLTARGIAYAREQIGLLAEGDLALLGRGSP
jgi:DNA-binding PadR family transcriptional regulator